MIDRAPVLPSMNQAVPGLSHIHISIDDDVRSCPDPRDRAELARRVAHRGTLRKSRWFVPVHLAVRAAEFSSWGRTGHFVGMVGAVTGRGTGWGS